MFAPLLAKLTGRARRESPGPGAVRSPSADDREHLVVRRLCEAIDRATRLGQWSHADRLAASAARLGPRYPRLTERLARLKLVRGRPHEALAVIEACRLRGTSLRLLRSVCLLLVGRLADAHLELHAWSRDGAAPPDARLLSALLDWQAGDLEGATRTLLHNLRPGQPAEEADTLALLVLLSRRQRRDEQARRFARRLGDATGFGHRRAETRVLLHTMTLEDASRRPHPTAHQAATLAMELTSCETAIPTLVEARRLAPEDRPGATLLREAIDLARPDLSDETAACEALARLSLILDEPHAAGAWAQRALRLQPMSVSARLLVRECDDAITPPPTPAETRPDDVIGVIEPPAEKGRAA